MAVGRIAILFLTDILFFSCAASMVERHAIIVVSFFLFSDITNLIFGIHRLLHLYLQAKERFCPVILFWQSAIYSTVVRWANSIWI